VRDLSIKREFNAQQMHTVMCASTSTATATTKCNKQTQFVLLPHKMSLMVPDPTQSETLTQCPYNFTVVQVTVYGHI